MRHASRRGRYDRSIPSAVRDEQQSLAILLATIVVLDRHGNGGITVERVIEEARVGRSSFYAHFRDVADATQAARRYAADALFSGVEAAKDTERTPLETLRTVSAVWLVAVQSEPVLARVLLCHTSHGARNPRERDVFRRWVDVLTGVMDEARRAGLVATRLTGGEESLRLLAVAGQYYAFGVRAATEGVETEPASMLLAELALRAMR